MRSLFVYISLLAYTLAFAQYDAATTSSVFHSINSNPGITGNKNDMVINLSFRNDWLGDDVIEFSADT